MEYTMRIRLKMYNVCRQKVMVKKQSDEWIYLCLIEDIVIGYCNAN